MPAFPGNTSAVIFEAILNRPPAALDRLHSDLARILGKALEKDRALRYQSAADLRADLIRLQRDSESGRTQAAPPKAASSAPRGRKGLESLAVLPLVNASGNEDAEYLSEGIAESLINSLSQLGRLRVAQPQKAFRYRGADVDLQRAARELGVQGILTGRLLLRGDTLVVKVNLVDIEKDAQVWGQQFTKTMADIFILQDEIAEQVLQALKLRLSSEPKRHARKQTPSTEVYHLYLKGRHYSAKRTAPNTTKALEFFQQAIDLDPTYAAAYAGIADCYAHLGFTPYGSMKPADAYPRAKTAAQKALSLDPSLGDAYASLGMCEFFFDWDWIASERAFQRCLELTPESLGARVWYPMLLASIGRWEDAIREAQRAAQIDPLSVNAAAALAQVLYLTRRFDEASTALTRALELDPRYPTAVVFVGFVHLARHNFAEGIAVLEQTTKEIHHPHFLAHNGLAYGLAGRREDALRVLDELTGLAAHSYVSPISFAFVYQGLGDRERWRAMMQAAFEERNGFLALLNAPWNDSVRDDPFFAELRRKVGLPERRDHNPL